MAENFCILDTNFTIDKPQDVVIVTEVAPDYTIPLADGRRKIIKIVMTTADGGSIVQPTKD